MEGNGIKTKERKAEIGRRKEDERKTKERKAEIG